MSQHKHLYNRSAWRKLRERQLRAEPFCRMHAQLNEMVIAGVVDHVKAHRADEELFFDERNLQSLCKPCHDAHKQAQENNADGILRGAGHDGRPLDLSHPWHRPVMPQVGGDSIFGAPPPKTASEPPCAKPRNSRGGLSAPAGQ